jgi:hypothetical protein
MAAAPASLRTFTEAEVRAATLDFADGRRLGTGASATVFGGTLADGTRVAVKCLLAAHSADLLRELQMFAEVPAHPNIIRAIGVVRRAAAARGSAPCATLAPNRLSLPVNLPTRHCAEPRADLPPARRQRARASHAWCILRWTAICRLRCTERHR